MEDLPHIPVMLRDAYYEAAESEARWYPRDHILEVDLGERSHLPRFHAAAMAVNVEQVVFGLSPDKEVVTLEVIGGRFTVDAELELELPSRRANILIAPDRWETGEREGSTPHEGLTFDYGRQSLGLAVSPDYRLFRVQFDGREGTRLVSPSPWLVYGIRNGRLAELWVLDPTRSRMD